MNAMKPESVLNNEQTLITIDAGGYDVSFKQIAGLLARRIVCNLKVGDRVERGQRMGLIKFGSRVDVLIPAEANLKVKTGSRVKGGSTVLAVIPEIPVQTKSAAMAVVA
jgi:phosphatidylserine decarboxylase